MLVQLVALELVRVLEQLELTLGLYITVAVVDSLAVKVLQVQVVVEDPQL
jgi:hypothetical protein